MADKGPMFPRIFRYKFLGPETETKKRPRHFERFFIAVVQPNLQPKKAFY